MHSSTHQVAGERPTRTVFSAVIHSPPPITVVYDVGCSHKYTLTCDPYPPSLSKDHEALVELKAVKEWLRLPEVNTQQYTYPKLLLLVSSSL